MVESTELTVLVTDGVENLNVNFETKVMLRDDSRFLKLKIKQALEGKDDLVEQMSQLKIGQEADLDLRPLDPALLSQFASVAEFIQDYAGINQDDALQKVCDSFDQYSKFVEINQFLENNTPELKDILQ